MIAERPDHKNLIIGILIVLVIALAAGNAYFAFIKKEEKPVNNGNENKQEEKKEEIEVPKEETKYQAYKYDEMIKKYVDYNGKESKYEINNKKLPIEITISVDKNYVITLAKDGSISIKEKGKDKTKKTITNIKKAISIDSIDKNIGRFYIILDNGDLYTYELDDFENKKYEATKIDEVKEATKFVSIKYCPVKDSGCDSFLGVLDKNNMYIEIDNIGY